jgi:hypothetical protein
MRGYCRPTDVVESLEDGDSSTGARQVSGSDEAVVSAADDDDLAAVSRRHAQPR